MEIHLTGRNLEVTPALKNYTTEKMQKLKQRDHSISAVHVSLHLEKLDHFAEGTLHFIGTDIHATAKATDMYSAIDLLIDKLVGQVIKHKDKIAGR